jgi:hypothetical protein
LIEVACRQQPHAIALAVSLNKQFGLSFGKIATVFGTVRTSPVVVTDETVVGLCHGDHNGLPHFAAVAAFATLSRWSARISRAGSVRDRRGAGTISAHGVDVARGHLFNQVLDLLDDPGTIQEVQRFARHLTVELPALFSFLVDPALDPTNRRAGRALRPAVITGKVCGGGNRSARGAETQQVLASILRTAHQRGLDYRERSGMDVSAGGRGRLRRKACTSARSWSVMTLAV